MMDRKDYIPDDDRHIEELFRPRCEFHASPELHARIISEAKRLSSRKPWYTRWKAIAAAAAAVAVIIAGVVAALHNAEGHSSQVLAVSTDSDTPSPSLIENPAITDITEDVSPKADDSNKEDQEKKNYRKSRSGRKNLTVNNVITSKNVEVSEQIILPHPVSADEEKFEYAQLPAGPMPSLAETEAKVAEKTMLTTEECDENISMIRAAYMNNIEHMREEVAETKIFIQEMRVSCAQNLK